MATDCIFCRIVEGAAPAVRVYEDDDTLAFADIFPLERGHLLVVPKVHVRDAYELDEDMGARLFRVTLRLAKVMKRVLEPEGMNLFQANEVAAGQEVFHFHMHILPRWAARQPFTIRKGRPVSGPEELEEVFGPVRLAVER